MASDGPRLNVFLTEDAYAGWTRFKNEHGTGSVAALVEAVGLLLAQTEGKRLTTWQRGVVREARRIADERAKRGL